MMKQLRCLLLIIGTYVVFGGIGAQAVQAGEIDVTHSIVRFWCALDDGDGDRSEMNLIRSPDRISLRVRYMSGAFTDRTIDLPVFAVTYGTSDQVYTVHIGFGVEPANYRGFAEARMLDRNRITNRPRGQITLKQEFSRKAFNCHVEGDWGWSS